MDRVHEVVHGPGPQGWSMDWVHRGVHGPGPKGWSMFCIRPGVRRVIAPGSNQFPSGTQIYSLSHPMHDELVNCITM